MFKDVHRAGDASQQIRNVKRYKHRSGATVDIGEWPDGSWTMALGPHPVQVWHDPEVPTQFTVIYPDGREEKITITDATQELMPIVRALSLTGKLPEVS